MGGEKGRELLILFIYMKEREPDFENEKIRASLIRPPLEGRVEREHDLEGLEKDPTVITIDEETEEIFESRAYHFKPGPETFSFLLGSLAKMMGEDLVEIPPQELVDHVMDMIEGAGIKFLAKRRKEDGRITFILVGISRHSRSFLDRQELVEEADYRKAVQEFEELPLSRAILSPPAVVTLEEWRRYGEEGPLSRSEGEAE